MKYLIKNAALVNEGETGFYDVLIENELATAKEAFVSSTTKRTMPVVQVDGLTIGDGKPGKVTGHIFELLVGEEEQYLAGLMGGTIKPFSPTPH